jgi:hypothetical protein
MASVINCNRRNFNLLALIQAIALPSFSQIKRIDPAQPKWGDRVVITYDPQMLDARFSASDKIFVKVWLSFSDH